MKRAATILTLLVTAPLLMGGGFLPPTPSTSQKFVGRTISAHVVIDTTGDSLDPGTGLPGAVTAIFERGGNRAAAAVNNISTAAWSQGCDVAFRTAQFTGVEVVLLIPPPAYDKILVDLGLPADARLVFSDVFNGTCTDNPSTEDPQVAWFSFDALVNQLVPLTP